MVVVYAKGKHQVLFPAVTVAKAKRHSKGEGKKNPVRHFTSHKNLASSQGKEQAAIPNIYFFILYYIMNLALLRICAATFFIDAEETKLYAQKLKRLFFKWKELT
jgi:hypothetical protein